MKKTYLIISCLVLSGLISCKQEERVSVQSWFRLGDEKLHIKDYYASMEYAYRSDSSIVYYYHLRFYTGDRYPLIDSQNELYQERGTGWQIELVLSDESFPQFGSGLYPDPNQPRALYGGTPNMISYLAAYYYEDSKLSETNYWSMDSCQLELNVSSAEIELLSDYIAMSRYDYGSNKSYIQSEMNIKEELKPIFITR